MSDETIRMPSATDSLWRSTWVTLLCAALIEAFVHCGGAMSDANLLESRFHRPDKMPGIGDSLVYWKYRYLLTPDKQPRYYPVVLIGDSSCTMGVIPDVIQERSGLDTMNLATHGGATLDVQNEILELHIAKHGTPRIVILQMSDHILCGGIRLSQVHEYRQQILDWSMMVQNKASFPWHNPLLALPSVRRRQMILNEFWSLCSSQPRGHFLALARGAWPSDVEVGQRLKETNGYLEFPLSDPPLASVPNPKIAPDWLPMLKRIFETSQRYGFDLVMIMTPLTDKTMLPESAEDRSRMADELAALAQSYPRVTIHTPAFTRIYPAKLMGDGIHMARSGAERNSQDIASWLGEFPPERHEHATRPQSKLDPKRQ